MEPADLRTGAYALGLGSAYWPNGTQVTRKPLTLLGANDGMSQKRVADRQPQAM